MSRIPEERPVRLNDMRIPLALLLLLALMPAEAAFSASGETRGALEQARQSVVTVITTDTVTRRPGTLPFFREETVGSNILGSGIVISEDGLILTAYHAVAGLSEISIVSADLREQRASVLAVEPALDLAILQIRSLDLKPITWRMNPSPGIGEDVYAIGTPGVFSNNPVPSVTRGIVSALHRTLDVSWDPREVVMLDLLETDVQLLPGESGGALVDAQGKLLGMGLAIYHPSGTIHGRAFAIAADDWLRKGLDAMITGDQFPIGYIGVRAGTLDLDTTRRRGLGPNDRVTISDIHPEGPLYLTELRKGDIITHLNSRRIRNASELRQIEMRLVPGDNTTLVVLRGAPPEQITIDFKVANLARTPAAKRADFSWRGMKLADIDDGIRREYGIPLRTGVAVIGVVRNSSAFKAGLRVGDVINEVNNSRVDRLASFIDAVESIPASNVVKIQTTEGVGHVQGEGRQR